MENKKAVFQKLCLLAIPIALQNLINVGVSTADTLMIGNISEVQLSGISQANQIYFIFTTILFGLASGSVVLTAQYWGRKELEPIRAILGLMIRIGIISGLAISVAVLLNTETAMRIFTNEPEVITYGAKYLRIVGFSYLFSGFTGVYLMGLRSIENVKASMYIYGISFLLNVVLNSILIFGLFGMPRMEIEGAALATLICRILESAMTVYYMYRKETVLCFRLPDLFRRTRQYLKSLLRFSVPVLLSEVHWGLGISVQAAIIGRLGVSVLTACSFINIVQQLGGIVLIGIGVGAGILIGNMIGAGKKKEAMELSHFLLKVSLMIGAIVACMILIIRPFAPNLIKAGEETVALIKQMLFVSAYLLFFQSLTILTMAGILRGAGDTIYCVTFDILTLWGLKVGCGLLATAVLHLNPVLVYFILSSDEMIKAAFTVPRVLRGRWIHDTTIHQMN